MHARKSHTPPGSWRCIHRSCWPQSRAARAASTDKPAVLGGGPVRTAPFPSWPVIAGNEERAWMDVLRKRQMEPPGWRLRAPVRRNLGRNARRQTLPGHRQRHERAVHLSQCARHRTRRRSDRAALHLRGHGQRRAAATRAAGVRRHRSRNVPDRRAQDRSRHHRSHALHPARAPGRLTGRPRHHPRRSAASTRCQCSRMPARRIWPSGAARRSARWARSAASASRRRRT